MVFPLKNISFFNLYEINAEWIKWNTCNKSITKYKNNLLFDRKLEDILLRRWSNTSYQQIANDDLQSFNGNHGKVSSNKSILYMFHNKLKILPYGQEVRRKLIIKIHYWSYRTACDILKWNNKQSKYQLNATTIPTVWKNIY